VVVRHRRLRPRGRPAALRPGRRSRRTFPPAAALAARALATGRGTWLGDPREGVIVLPVLDLLDRYDGRLPEAR